MSKMIHTPLGQLQARTLTITTIFRQCSGHLDSIRRKVLYPDVQKKI